MSSVNRYFKFLKSNSLKNYNVETSLHPSQKIFWEKKQQTGERRAGLNIHFPAYISNGTQPPKKRKQANTSQTEKETEGKRLQMFGTSAKSQNIENFS